MLEDNQMSFKKLALAAAIASLVGCGGSGGGDSSASINDNNSSASINDNNSTLAGSIQKGPFVSGASITVYELDENLKQTGISHRTNTTDNKGSYSLPASIQSRYVEVYADGYYYDETTGKDSDSPYELSAIIDVQEVHTANLNLLTSLAKDRIRSLVAGGNSFSEANKQTKQEVLRVFNLQNFDVELYDLDILQPTDAGGILLAASSTLMQLAHNVTSGSVGSELTSLMANIKSDLNDNGIIDTDSIKTKIIEASIQIDIPSVKSALQKKFELTDAPKMENYLDNDGDGEIGANALKKLSTLVEVDTAISDSGNIISATNIARPGAISNDKKKAIILGGTKGFQIYDISKPESPANIGSFVDGDRIAKADLSSDGNTLFTISLSSGNGLSIFDISKPASPKLIGSILKSSNGEFYRNFELSGDGELIIAQTYPTYEYFNGTDLSLPEVIDLIDVSNPSSPIITGTYILPKITSWTSMTISDIALSSDSKTLFIGNVSATGELRVIDISDPKNISVLAYDTINSGMKLLNMNGNNFILKRTTERAANGLMNSFTKAFKFKDLSFTEIATIEGLVKNVVNSDVYISDSTVGKLKQYSFDERNGFKLVRTNAINGNLVFSSDGKLMLTEIPGSIDLYGF